MIFQIHARPYMQSALRHFSVLVTIFDLCMHLYYNDKAFMIRNAYRYAKHSCVP